MTIANTTERATWRVKSDSAQPSGGSGKIAMIGSSHSKMPASYWVLIRTMCAAACSILKINKTERRATITACADVRLDQPGLRASKENQSKLTTVSTFRLIGLNTSSRSNHFRAANRRHRDRSALRPIKQQRH